MEKKIKLLIGVITICFFTLSIFNCSVVSAESGLVQSSTQGDLFKYSVSKEGVIIKGLNDTTVKELVIPAYVDGNQVIEIADNAFYGYKNLTSVEIPNSVKRIGVGAFRSCNNLEEITVPFIGVEPSSSTLPYTVFGAIFDYTTKASAYAGTATATISGTVCQYYKHFPNGAYNAKYIGYHYYIPESLKAVTVTNATEVPNNAFNGCTMLEQISLNNQITKIGDSAFEKCNNVESLYLADGLQTIGSNVFPKSMLIYANEDTAGYTYAKENGLNVSSTSSIALNKTEQVLYKGDACMLKAEVMNLSGEVKTNPIIEWISSDETVVKVDDVGYVTVVGPGKCTVTAIHENYSAECSFIVLYPIEKISFSISEMLIEIKTSERLPVTYTPYNTTDDKTLEWTSSDETIAIVDNDGIVKGLANGTTTITATAQNGVNTSIKINVGHHWNDEYTVDNEATCTAEGSKSIHCNRCDEIKDSVVISKLKHNYGSWIVDSYATCTADGSKHKTCTGCNDKVVEVISATGHKWEANYKLDKDSTCVVEGVKSIHCENCSERKDMMTIPLKEHSYGSWIVNKRATCTNDGSKYKKCYGCEKVTTEIIPATGHQWEKNYTIDEFEDCIIDGSKSKHCSVCNVKNESTITVIPASGHLSGSWIIEKEPTCTEIGYKYKKCTACRETIISEEIPENGHNYQSKVTFPTCTEQGYTTYTCECGDSYVGEYTNKTNHEYSGVVTTPTCIEQGFTTYTCECGDSYVGNYKVAVGHTIIKDIAVSATCAYTGLTEGTHCSACNEILVKQQVVPKLEHKYKTETVKASLSENGTVITECDNCGDVKSDIKIYYPKTVELTKSKYVYNGSMKKPVVKVVGSNGKVISSDHYKVTYAKGRKVIGKYKVTVKFNSNKYTGTKVLYFTINPAGNAIKSLKSKKQGVIDVTWSKKTNVNGYQIRYSTKSNMSTYNSKTVSNKSTTTKKITGLKAGTKYYVQVRTYKRVAGTKYYSDWSSKKSVITYKNPSLTTSSAIVHNSKKVTLKFTGGSGKIKWTSSNPKVATVSSSGVVTGLKAGTCTIKATRNGITSKCKVTVPNTYKENSRIPDYGALYGLKVYYSDSDGLAYYKTYISDLDTAVKYESKLYELGFSILEDNYYEDHITWSYYRDRGDKTDLVLITWYPYKGRIGITFETL